MADGRLGDTVTIEIDFSASAAPGEFLVAVHQTLDGKRILGAEGKLFFVDGALVSINALFADVDLISQPPSAPQRERLATSVYDILGTAQELEVLYDLKDEVWLSRFATDTGQAVYLNLSSGVVEADKDTRYYGGDYNQLVSTRTYPDTSTSMFDPGNPACIGLNGNLNPSSQQGFLTAASCSSASAQGCTSPFQGTCLYSLSAYQPEYALGLPVLQLLYGGDPWVSFGNSVQTQGQCVSTFQWPAAPSSGDMTNVLDAPNAYSWLKQLKVVRDDWTSFYNVYPSPLAARIDVTLADTNPVQNGQPILGLFRPYPTYPRQLRLFPGTAANGFFHASLDLYVMTHEYTHYLMDSMAGGGSAPLKEGFADTGPLRFAVYQSLKNNWPSAGYWMAMNRNVIAHQHTQRVKNGEFILSPVLASSADQLYYRSPWCSGSTPNNYKCGAVVGLVYWELAWNRARLSFDISTEGDEIVQAGAYAHMGWALANSAFAYAAANTTSTSDMVNFFDLVVSRYQMFYNQGYLDYNSYIRVLDVLGHHCLGPGDVCSPTYTGHKLPGSPLGSSLTRKTQFIEAENASSAGSATVVFDGNSSGGRLLRISGAVSGIVVTYNIGYLQLDIGNPYLKVVARGSSFPTTTEYSINGGPFVPAATQLNSSGNTWAWVPLGVIPAVVGTNQVRLRFTGGSNYNFDLDAVIIDAKFSQRRCACTDGQTAECNLSP